MPDSQREEVFTRGDRDNLITLNVKVDNIKDDIKDLKDNVVGRVQAVENLVHANQEKLEILVNSKQKEIDDLFMRVNSLEGFKSKLVGIGSAVMIFIGLVGSLLVYIYFSDLNHIRAELDKHVEQTK